MAGTYDKVNKIKEKYEKDLKHRDLQIEILTNKLNEAEEEVKKLRKQLYDAGEGKGEQNRLKKIINNQEREKKTLQNQLYDLSGEKLINTFSPERQNLIRNIKALEFPYSMFNSLALRFINGLDNVIEIAARIQKGYAEDMDFFTYVFRDNIVSLLEKMLKEILNKSEESASKYLVKLANGNYRFPSDYYKRIPELKNKETLNHILYLINLQTTGYHGTKTKYKHVVVNKDTNEVTKTDKFLNLTKDQQLNAIFTLLEFMYDVFSNKDHESNLFAISKSWYTTMNFND